MNKVLNIIGAIKISKKLQNLDKKIVLAGGCFDILHVGHIEYLTNAKKAGDILFVFLESDQAIKKIKGDNRPINSQKDRAKILESLAVIDYIIPLPFFRNNIEYDKLVTSIKPAIIAITKGDHSKKDKIRQGKIVNAKVVEVTATIQNKSTTKLIKILKEI